MLDECRGQLQCAELCGDAHGTLAALREMGDTTLCAPGIIDQPLGGEFRDDLGNDPRLVASALEKLTQLGRSDIAPRQQRYGGRPNARGVGAPLHFH